jgi:hypothetical protein
VYDDACHLKRYIKKKCEKNKVSERLINFNKKVFVVDKLHIQGHTEEWCLENCHPRKFSELNKVNTMVCEQINYWLGGFKHAMKYMNVFRFNFFFIHYT